MSFVRVASALSVVLSALDVALAAVEVTELVELVFVVAAKAAASALSRSEVVVEIAETDIMHLREMPDTHPCCLSAGGKKHFKTSEPLAKNLSGHRMRQGTISDGSRR
jgi:hypothetical protein